MHTLRYIHNCTVDVDIILDESLNHPGSLTAPTSHHFQIYIKKKKKISYIIIHQLPVYH